MVHKLGYEWKQIYRNCVTIDSDNQGILHIDDFVRCCEKNGVSLIPLEVKKLMKLFSIAANLEDLIAFGYDSNPHDAEEIINYKRLSIGLGLHKESFNYLSKVQSLNRIQNISKLRQLYQQNENVRCKINKGEYDSLINQKGLFDKNSKSTHGLVTLGQILEENQTLKDA